MRKLYSSLAVVALAVASWIGAAVPAPADSLGQVHAGGAAPGVQIADAMANFGSPPSGEIPILFNDHHVYSKPDELKQNRVLAALVRNGTILVPLRSMFEQMGATVSYDPATKTATAQKPGASVAVTVGKAEVVINGEARPLDVPPEIYKGVVVVPIRVISEGLGAYVQWVPSQRVAVVRYLPPTPVPTPPPTAPPTAPPTPAPTSTPTPAPAAPSYNGFIEGAYSFSKIANEFANNVNGNKGSYLISGAYLINPFAIKVDFRSDQYTTTTNGVIPAPSAPPSICNPSLSPNPSTPGGPATVFNTIDGGVCYVPPFTARQTNIDGRLEYKVADPHINIGVSYMQATTNYGYPRLNGVGFGVEKLPDFTGAFSVFGSAFYYPSMQGNYTVLDPQSPNVGVTYKQIYRITKYDIGFNYVFGRSPLYLYAGFAGDQYVVKQNAPVNQTHSGPYVGLGFRF